MTRIEAPVRTRIARAVIEQLKPLTREHGGYLQAIEQAPLALEKVDQEVFQHLIHDLAGRAPAVVVALDDERDFDSTDVRKMEWRRVLDVRVYALSTHRGDLVKGREDPGADAATSPHADPGLRAITEDIGRLLSGQSLKLDAVELLRPTTLRGLWADQGYTVWEWVFRLPYTLSSITEREDAVTSVVVDNTTAGAPLATELLQL